MLIRPNGKEIRQRRIALGLSGSAFARMIKVSRVTVSNIENGNDGAAPQMLKKIADGLNCRIEDISYFTDTVRVTVELSKNRFDYFAKLAGTDNRFWTEEVFLKILNSRNSRRRGYV